MEEKTIILSRQKKILNVLGENIKLARLRRKFSPELVAERAGIECPLLALIEQGNPDIALGHYLNVLAALNLESDLSKLASDDILGRKLQDLELLMKDNSI